MGDVKRPAHGRIYQDVTELIGGTPLVMLNRLTEGLPGRVAVKLESANPANSVKDRIGAAIIDAAVASGQLKPGGTVVEGTSGNTGIALAMVGAARGFNVVLTMPETMSVERRIMLKAFGAEIVLTPGADGMRGAVEKAEEIVASTPNAVLARQFENEANPRVHAETTAEEILEDTHGELAAFVAGVGTGGTVTGVGRVLRKRAPQVKIAVVEPADSPILSGGKAGPHKIQGLGANFVPDVLDRDVYSEVFDVELDDALTTARDLGRFEGIAGGISAGANVFAALQMASREEYRDKLIVTVVPDFSERYISTALYEDLR